MKIITGCIFLTYGWCIFTPGLTLEFGRIETLIKQVKKEEWDNPVLYAGGEYPSVVLAKMRAAILSPQPFPPTASKLIAKAGFNPDDGSKVPTYIDDMVGTIKRIGHNIAFARKSRK